MKTLFLLVLLSQNSAGDINASFVTAEDEAQCQVKQKVVEGIFSSAKVPILESSCTPSSYRFTEFQHSTSSGSQRYFYLIDFSAQKVEVTQAQGWRHCMEQQQQKANSKFYCGSSIQEMLN